MIKTLIAAVIGIVSFACEIPGTVNIGRRPFLVDTDCWFNANVGWTASFELNRTRKIDDLHLAWAPSVDFTLSLSWDKEPDWSKPIQSTTSQLWFQHDLDTKRDIYHCIGVECLSLREEEELGNLYATFSFSQPGNYLFRMWFEPTYNIIRPDQLEAYSTFRKNCCALTGSCPPPSRDCRNIHGIECDENGYVKLASFSDWGLHCTANDIQALVNSWTKLVSLDLSHNQLIGAGLNLEQTNLVTIDIQNNKFSGPIFCLPPTAHEFWSSANNFSGGLPECWEKHSNLHVMVISHNIELGGELNLVNYPNLILLDLSMCNMIGNLYLTKESFPQLQSLNLDFNGFHGTLPSIVFDPPNTLKILSLIYNQFQDELRVFIRPIAHLFLAGNHLYGTITSDTFNVFNDLTSTVDISSNQFTGSPPDIHTPHIIGHGNFFNCPSPMYVGRCTPSPEITKIGITNDNDIIAVYGKNFVVSPENKCIDENGLDTHFDRVNTTFGFCRITNKQETIRLSNFFPHITPSKPFVITRAPTPEQTQPPELQPEEGTNTSDVIVVVIGCLLIITFA
jgi:hypothetical protein